MKYIILLITIHHKSIDKVEKTLEVIQMLYLILQMINTMKIL